MNDAKEEYRVRSNGYAQCFGEDVALIEKTRKNKHRNRQKTGADNKNS